MFASCRPRCILHPPCVSNSFAKDLDLIFHINLFVFSSRPHVSIFKWMPKNYNGKDSDYHWESATYYHVLNVPLNTLNNFKHILEFVFLLCLSQPVNFLCNLKIIIACTQSLVPGLRSEKSVLRLATVWRIHKRAIAAGLKKDFPGPQVSKFMSAAGFLQRVHF